MNERKLILIKHASPLIDPTKSSEQWKLSEKGRESCISLAQMLRPYKPGIFITSAELKAKETAEICGRELNVPVETALGLHEHDRSNVPHMRSGEFISHVELFFRRPGELVLGKETADQALRRMESAIGDVLTKHPAGNVAVVSHGTVIALFIAKYAKRPPFELWREMGLPSFAVLSLSDYGIEKLIARLPIAG